MPSFPLVNILFCYLNFCSDTPYRHNSGPRWLLRRRTAQFWPCWRAVQLRRARRPTETLRSSSLREAESPTRLNARRRSDLERRSEWKSVTQAPLATTTHSTRRCLQRTNSVVGNVVLWVDDVSTRGTTKPLPNVTSSARGSSRRWYHGATARRVQSQEPTGHRRSTRCPHIYRDDWSKDQSDTRHRRDTAAVVRSAGAAIVTE